MAQRKFPDIERQEIGYIGVSEISRVPTRRSFKPRPEKVRTSEIGTLQVRSEEQRSSEVRRVQRRMAQISCV